MKQNQIKKTTNPFTYYQVEWQNWRDKTIQEVFLTKGEADFYSDHLRTVENLDFVHVYEITEKLL